MVEHVVANASDVPEDGSLVVQIEGRELGIFLVDGEYRAYLNWCMHQSGPVCEGTVTGTKMAEFDRDTLTTTVTLQKDGEILNCPWHGWEYDLTDGKCYSREGVTLPSFPVEDRDGELVVTF